jgi:hypothetical protein
LFCIFSLFEALDADALISISSFSSVDYTLCSYIRGHFA